MRNSSAAVLLSVASWAAADCQSDVIPWPEGSGDLFGSGVAGDAGTVVVGVPDASLGGLFEHGRVLVSNSEGILVELPLPPQESGLQVGSDVAVSGGFAFASCTGRTDGFDGNVGGVLFWAQVSTNSWSAPQLLSRPDWDDQFFAGYQIAASNGLLAVSVPGLVGGFPAGGGAVDFWTFGGPDGFEYAGRITGSDPHSFFGASLDLNASHLVVGAPTIGAGRVHVYDRFGASFSYRGYLEGSSDGDQFGASVALYGSTLFVGAPRVGPFNVGAAYRYDLQSELSGPNMTYPAPEGATANSRFGLSITGDDQHVCASGFSNGHAAIWRAETVQGLPDSMITTSFTGRIRDVYSDGNGLFYLPDEFPGEVKVLNPRLDCDLNGVCDSEQEGPDCNGNGIPDAPCDVVTIGDCDNNGVPDDCQSDCDGDGIIDGCEDDDDNDGIPDDCDADSCGPTGPDCNGNGTLDSCDILNGDEDCDANGIPDQCDIDRGAGDCNTNGVPDQCEGLSDCNSNGTPDVCEKFSDCNGNSIPDECELDGNDCDGNGIPDDCQADCDNDSVPDNCEDDCNSDGTPDKCQTFPDCNLNSIPDECELKGNDCDIDGVPDECQPDCDMDGVPDACELDCNRNGLPDDCDLDQGSSEDCDSNGIPDECDLTGVAADCDNNMLLDTCEITANPELDCDSNQVLDVCDVLQPKADCNMNGIPDPCDISDGFSSDCDKNNQPDECQLLDGSAIDCNENKVLDICDIKDGSLDQNANMIPDECECIADLNGDNFVDLLDIIEVLAQWLAATDGLPDIDGDGTVGLGDLMLVLNAYGPCEL